MVPKRTSTFLISVLIFLVAQGPRVHAVPISRLLSIAPVSSESSPFTSLLLSPSSPSSSSSSPLSLKLSQSKKSPRRRSQRIHTRGVTSSDPHSTTPTSTSTLTPNPVQDETTWQSLQQDQQSEQKPIVPAITEMMWTDRTLEGHAVVDEDDDDDGNELLDTESERLWGSDVDDEIEGEVLEEDYEEHDDKEDGVDLDQDEILGLHTEVWEDVVHKLSMVAGLTRKEAMANSWTSIVGPSSSSA